MLAGEHLSRNPLNINSVYTRKLGQSITCSLIGSRALSQLHPDGIGIMWLLNSHGSNLMKHLLPYLQDDQKAADYLRQVRWPDGVTCPRCGNDAVEPRERCDNGLQRFNCVPCAARLGQQFAMFTDWTNSIFEESKLRPVEWLLVMGLWQLKLNATDIAAAADIQERTAQRCINLLDGGIYETYHLDPTRPLAHQVEADECYQSAGSKGLPREVERWASITASATFGHSASPDNVTCWRIMALQ